MNNLDAYTEIPYPAQITSTTHPDNLAMVAWLLGVDAPDPRSARVLEIGCADGGNLIPMAGHLPGATFVGVDLSPDHIQQAKGFGAVAGLENVTWRAADLRDLGDDEPYDYIIAHGVWSWIDGESQTALLEGCARLLSERGVAYVSYNVWPGWSQRYPARKMMQWFTKDAPSGRVAVAQAKMLAGWLAQLPPNRRMVGTAMKKVLAEFRGLDDWYVFHEYLAVHNEPVLFSDFVDRSRQAGLAYLGDASLAEMVPFDLPEEVQEGIAGLSKDRESYEQMLDFVRERAFRRTLLVRQGVAADYNVDSRRMERLQIAGRLRLPSDWTLDDTPQSVASWPIGGAPTSVDDVKGMHVVTAAEKRAVKRIAEAWPASVSVAELVDDAGDGASRLRQQLLVAALQGALHLFATPQRACAASDRPYVCETVRAEVSFRTDDNVTNRWHGPVHIDRTQAWVIQRLDGTRTRQDLEDELIAAFSSHLIPIPHDIGPDEEGLTRWLDALLSVLADAVLLTEPPS